jgi:hypothetical protein
VYPVIQTHKILWCRSKDGEEGEMYYAKIWESMINSSIWLEDHDVLRVWLYLLLKADSNGIVDVSLPGLAHQCLVSVDRAKEILARLNSPDEHSKTPDEQGRRILICTNPWHIRVVNFQKYMRQDLPHIRKRMSRIKRLGDESKESEERHQTSPRVTSSHPKSPDVHRSIIRSIRRSIKEKTHVQFKSPPKSDADPGLSAENSNAFALDDARSTKSEKEKPKSKNPQISKLFEEFWAAYPRKQAKKPAAEVYARLLKAAEDAQALQREILAGIETLKRTRQWREGYVPLPTTFLRQERWQDQPAPDEPVSIQTAEADDDLDMGLQAKAEPSAVAVEPVGEEGHYVEPEEAARKIRALLSRIGKRV